MIAQQSPNGRRRRTLPAVSAAAGLLVAALSAASLAIAPVASAAAAPAPNATCPVNVRRLVTAPPTHASTTSRLPAKLVASLDAAARSSFAVAATPGAIVGVRTPKGTWIKAYGYADPVTKRPMRADLHMRIGSVTKTATVTLLLQLAQEGKLSLSDPISKYYRGIPNGDRITLAMLANMTSGIASYFTPPFLARYSTNPESVFTPNQLIAFGVAASPIFAPGAQFNYSNTNTVLLGKVIEKVTGKPLATVLQQRIFTPLHLRNTSFPVTSTAIPKPYAQGYTLQFHGTPDHPANATHWNPSFGWAAGAMISTVRDMLTYDRALATGQGLLSRKSQIQRLDSMPAPASYGLGMGCIGGWIGHTGELPGYNATVYYDTTSNTSVVVLVNSDIASGNCASSPTLTDNPSQLPCSSPATRIFVGVSKALGHEFQANPTT